MEAGQGNQASRNLRQLRDEVEWRRLEGEVNSLEAQRREAAPPPAAQEPTVPAGAFRFRLEAVTHTPSAILSDEEFTRVTAPFVGRDVAIADLKAMLEAVNALYREKGYVVCEARLAPQRIRGGRLLVTLVEGRTGCTTVSGAEHTSAGHGPKGPFSAPPFGPGCRECLGRGRRERMGQHHRDGGPSG